jgi:hypothetical protein
MAKAIIAKCNVRNTRFADCIPVALKNETTAAMKFHIHLEMAYEDERHANSL